MCFYTSVNIVFSYTDLLIWIIIGVDVNRHIKRFMKLNYAFFLKILYLQYDNYQIIHGLENKKYF